MAASLKIIDGDQAKNMNNSDREKALDAALAQIDRAFGKGSAMKLGSREAIKIDAVSTGSLGSGYCAWNRRSAKGACH